MLYFELRHHPRKHFTRKTKPSSDNFQSFEMPVAVLPLYDYPGVDGHVVATRGRAHDNTSPILLGRTFLAFLLSRDKRFWQRCANRMKTIVSSKRIKRNKVKIYICLIYLCVCLGTCVGMQRIRIYACMFQDVNKNLVILNYQNMINMFMISTDYYVNIVITGLICLFMYIYIHIFTLSRETC